MHKIKITYIISSIDKALAFEWIALFLRKEGYDLRFILVNALGSELKDFLLLHQFDVVSIKCDSKKDWPSAWLILWRQLKSQKPDIVHCHLFTAGILGLSAAKFARIQKRIYTRHHSDYHFRYFPKGVKWDKLCNRLATKIIAPSNVVKNVLTEMENVPEGKVSVVYHGFDFQYFRNVSETLIKSIQLKYNPHQQYPVIGVISRFTELKGIQYIIPAFQQILKHYPNAKLLLFNAVGDYKNEIENLLAQLPSSSYETIPFETELAAVYRLFDVFIQASTDTNIESFGQTYIEALASGVPSVFTLAGVAPDFIHHQENAIVVPFKNIDAIVKGVINILENNELKDKIIKEGWNSVRDRFSLHEMINKLEVLYTS